VQGAHKVSPEEAKKVYSPPKVCPMEQLELGLWEAMKFNCPSFRCSRTQISNPTIPSRSI